MFNYKGAYRTGQSVVVNLVGSNGTYTGRIGAQQITLYTQTTGATHDLITGTYDTKSPNDSGTFSMTKIGSGSLEFELDRTGNNAECLLL